MPPEKEESIKIYDYVAEYYNWEPRIEQWVSTYNSLPVTIAQDEEKTVLVINKSVKLILRKSK
jgi:CRISPR/Cas system-associated endonuclease/helicase Cas3